MYDFEHMDPRIIAFVNIFICSNRLQAIMDNGLVDITAKQWLAIAMIEAFPEPPTLKQMSELSGVTHQSMRQIVDRLVDKGFLEVVPDKKDKRAIRLVKTEAANHTAEHTDTTLESDRRSGVGEVRSDSEGVSGSGRTDRGNEEHRPTEMGRSDEQLQGYSSGNGYQGDNRDRNSGYSISNEAEVINTSAFSVDEAIHSAFEEVSLNHSFSEKQQKFLDRIENFAVRNNVTENIINAAFERAAAFHNTYGNREFVSRNIFARRLGSIEKELEEAIRKNTAIVTAENVVITHAPMGYHDPYCLSRVNENGAIIDYYHDKNGDIPAFMDINAAQEYAARHGLKIQNSDESKKFGTQALVSTEINGEISYFKFTGMNLEDIMSVAADNGSLLR